MADVNKLHRRIELALEEQEYQEALSLARRAVDEDPADGIGWYYLLLADNETDNPETFLNRQRDWRRQKAYQQAVTHGGHADTLRELGREWAYRQAVALQQQKKYESALVYYKETGNYKDSVRRAGECQDIIEKALAEQKRLEAELESREAAERKARETAQRQAREASQGETAAKHTQPGAQNQAASHSAGASCLEGAAHLCREYLSLPYGNWAEEEAKELLGICSSLARRAKWGGCLDDARAYRDLAEDSSFWQVYGAEQDVGDLAGKLYDAETGAPEGLPWDDSIACYWAGIAAGKGDKSGCLQMGRFYECGVGVDSNFKLAAHFYNQAESRPEQIYFARLSRVAGQIGGDQNEIDQLENISSPPNFNISPTVMRVGSYWKFHKQAQLAKLRLDKRTGERMQELLAPQQEEFSAVDSRIAWLARKDNPGLSRAILAAVLPCVFWTYFVFHMGDYIERVDLLFPLIGIFTLPVVYVAVATGFAALFDSLQRNRIRRQAKKWRKLLGKIRRAYDSAVGECHKTDCPEYREYRKWTAKTEEMGRALRVTAGSWQHAYLMYYGAGIQGAETPDDADRYAANAAKKGRKANLPYVPAPFTRWMLQELSDRRKPVDLLEVAAKYGKDCRSRYTTGEGWKAVFALECILFHAKFWLKADLKTDAAFWRTNPIMLRELAGIYRKGSKELGQKANLNVSMVLTDFAAEIYKDQYRSGQLSPLAELTALYQDAGDSFEAERWARLACEKRCPQFAKYAFRYYRYYGEEDRAELDRYVNELVYSLDFRSREREEVLELRDKINDLQIKESKARENAQKVAQLQQTMAQSRAREAIEQELDRRERGLNILFGDGYMTNEELYLTGRQSVSDYVNNDIYRSARRSELEKRQREREM